MVFSSSYLPAFHAKVIDKRCHFPIRIDREMEVLMHQKIVPGSLTDDLEIVHISGLEAHLSIIRTLGLACSPVLVAGRQSHTADTLRLEVKRAVESTTIIDCGSEKHV